MPKLLSAARRIIDDKETEEDLRLLLAPGSSLAAPGRETVENEFAAAAMSHEATTR